MSKGSLPTPVIRYGDEIGMGDNLQLPERNCTRRPMQWSTEPNAGFTKNEKPILAVIDDGPYGFHHVNIADQRRDPNSLLNWMERIIRMRKEVPEIGWGDFTFIPTRMPAVLIMRYEWRNNAVLFVHNLSLEPREVRFSLCGKGEDGCALVNCLPKITVIRKMATGTAFCSSRMAIAGIEFVAWIICSYAAIPDRRHNLAMGPQARYPDQCSSLD